MSERGQNWKLIVGVTLMGLVGWSAYASSAEIGSPACAAKVKDEVAALTRKNGHAPSNSAQNNLLLKCSEAEVGLDVEGLFAKHSQEGTTDKESRCQNSVKFAKVNGLETSGRSDEALVNVCLALPSDHDPACGFPADGESYFVVENQSCVSKASGITSHGVVAKAEPRVRKHDGDPQGGYDNGGGGTGGSAQ